MRILKEHIKGSFIWKDRSPDGLPRWVVTKNKENNESTKIFNCNWYKYDQVVCIVVADEYRGEQ